MANGFITKVITIVGNDKHQYFHHHSSLADVFVENGVLTIRLELDVEYVSYSLHNLERYATKAK